MIARIIFSILGTSLGILITFLWTRFSYDSVWTRVLVGMWAIPAGLIACLVISDVRYGYSKLEILARELVALLLIVALFVATAFIYDSIRGGTFFVDILFLFSSPLIAAIVSDFIFRKKRYSGPRK